MQIHEIKIPSLLYYSELASWNDQICSTNDGDIIKLNFENIQFLGPFHMIYFLHRIRALIKNRPRSRIHIRNFEHLGYPVHMGFFQSIGANVGNGREKIDGDANFLPITIVSKADFVSKYGYRNIQDNIDSESIKLTQVLTKLGSGYIFDAVQYSMREMIRNIFEHSGSKEYYFCAQYYPNKNKVQMCICDEGMGISQSLRENPNYKDFSDRDALQLSLMPGVSGNYKALASTSSNQWQNSGYGLYMASRLCRNSGGFLIISSNYLINLRNQQKWDRPLQNFQGTLVKLDLDLSHKSSLSAKLKRYAEEGRELAKNIAGAKKIEASTASQMLTRDFETKI
jgi:hypothetical protein